MPSLFVKQSSSVYPWHLARIVYCRPLPGYNLAFLHGEGEPESVEKYLLEWIVGHHHHHHHHHRQQQQQQQPQQQSQQPQSTAPAHHGHYFHGAPANHGHLSGTAIERKCAEAAAGTSNGVDRAAPKEKNTVRPSWATTLVADEPLDLNAGGDGTLSTVSGTSGGPSSESIVSVSGRAGGACEVPMLPKARSTAGVADSTPPSSNQRHSRRSYASGVAGSACGGAAATTAGSSSTTTATVADPRYRRVKLRPLSGLLELVEHINAPNLLSEAPSAAVTTGDCGRHCASGCVVPHHYQSWNAITTEPTLLNKWGNGSIFPVKELSEEHLQTCITTSADDVEDGCARNKFEPLRKSIWDNNNSNDDTAFGNEGPAACAPWHYEYYVHYQGFNRRYDRWTQLHDMLPTTLQPLERTVCPKGLARNLLSALQSINTASCWSGPGARPSSSAGGPAHGSTTSSSLSGALSTAPSGLSCSGGAKASPVGSAPSSSSTWLLPPPPVVSGPALSSTGCPAASNLFSSSLSSSMPLSSTATGIPISSGGGAAPGWAPTPKPTATAAAAAADTTTTSVASSRPASGPAPCAGTMITAATAAVVTSLVRNSALPCIAMIVQLCCEPLRRAEEVSRLTTSTTVHTRRHNPGAFVGDRSNWSLEELIAWSIETMHRPGTGGGRSRGTGNASTNSPLSALFPKRLPGQSCGVAGEAVASGTKTTTAMLLGQVWWSYQLLCTYQQDVVDHLAASYVHSKKRKRVPGSTSAPTPPPLVTPLLSGRALTGVGPGSSLGAVGGGLNLSSTAARNGAVAQIREADGCCGVTDGTLPAAAVNGCGSSATSSPRSPPSPAFSLVYPWHAVLAATEGPSGSCGVADSFLEYSADSGRPPGTSEASAAVWTATTGGTVAAPPNLLEAKWSWCLSVPPSQLLAASTSPKQSFEEHSSPSSRVGEAARLEFEGAGASVAGAASGLLSVASSAVAPTFWCFVTPPEELLEASERLAPTLIRFVQTVVERSCLTRGGTIVVGEGVSGGPISTAPYELLLSDSGETVTATPTTSRLGTTCCGVDAFTDEVVSDTGEHEGMDKAAIEAHEAATKLRTIESIRIKHYCIPTWYHSPYPATLQPAKCIFICPGCLVAFRYESELRRHEQLCPVKVPPGNEIYRSGKISFFEVDGELEWKYCENLSLLSKLFLDHKTLQFNVAPFLFYVLLEWDDSNPIECTEDNDLLASHSTRRGSTGGDEIVSGEASGASRVIQSFGSEALREAGMVPARRPEIVGYFSKEKSSAMGYNLACILTLPQHQRKGYGKLFIHFSYTLSKIERKVGSPERPLSDLGRVSYTQYWKSVLAAFLLNPVVSPPPCSCFYSRVVMMSSDWWNGTAGSSGPARWFEELAAAGRESSSLSCTSSAAASAMESTFEREGRRGPATGLGCGTGLKPWVTGTCGVPMREITDEDLLSNDSLVEELSAPGADWRRVPLCFGELPLSIDDIAHFTSMKREDVVSTLQLMGALTRHPHSSEFVLVFDKPTLQEIYRSCGSPAPQIQAENFVWQPSSTGAVINSPSMASPMVAGSGSGVGGVTGPGGCKGGGSSGASGVTSAALVPGMSSGGSGGNTASTPDLYALPHFEHGTTLEQMCMRGAKQKLEYLSLLVQARRNRSTKTHCTV